MVEGRGNVDRLMLEPALLSKLRHPNIVGIEDYFLSGDDLVLALEFVEGRDLKSLLDEGVRFSQAEVRELLVQLAGALAEAAGKNVMHRDVKPANVLVVRSGGAARFVLTDFGIGEVAEGIQARKRTGGTFFYMAPEQLRGRPCPQSDLWALGVVAYQLLTGRLPFPGPTLGELTRQILYDNPVPPSAACAEPVDADLERAVMRLLDKSLQERVASAEELLTLLGRRGTATVVGEARRAGPAAASLDRTIDRGIKVRWAWLVVCVLLYLLPGGIPSGALMLLGLFLFYKAQAEEGRSRRAAVLGTGAALGALGSSLALKWLVPQYDHSAWGLVASAGGRLAPYAQEALQSLGPTVATLFLIAFAVALACGRLAYQFLLPAVAAALYAGMRRLQRERVLRDVALEAGTGSVRYLEVLGRTLKTRDADVGLHLKYAEALFARGRVKEAAVEAELLLEQDPYHFNGNLLLANAYHALGLLEECAAVCDRYLAVSGYCFEFGELREGCLRRLGKA